MRKRSVDQRLRIRVVYDWSVEQLNNDKQTLIKNDVIPAAVTYWEETLHVRQTHGPIRLLRQCSTDRVRYKDNDSSPYCVDGCENRTMCGETEVPNDHLEACKLGALGSGLTTLGERGAGVTDADFILYVSARSTPDRCVGSAVAYAAYCQLEGALDRPIAGYVNLCPDSISVQHHDLRQMHSVTKHELLHALGFSVGLFAFFRDINGEPLTPRHKADGKPDYNTTSQLYQWSDKVVRNIVRPQWLVRGGTISRTVQMIVTPNVLKEVRAHFNCSTLEGAELEDQGLSGTALTHWEKRVFENEVMTGTYTQNPVISRITLALLADTGWYRVNYEKAESYQWGRGLGCDFVTHSCKQWMIDRRNRREHVHPYCVRAKVGSALQTECTEERDAVALCNLIRYSEPLPIIYQHFDSIEGVAANETSRYAGNVALADYCPYIQELNWKKGETVVRGSRCNLHRNQPDTEINYSLETYSKESRCFDHIEGWSVHHCDTTYPVEHWGAGCYKYSCTTESGLVIHVDDQSLKCRRAGERLNIRHLTSDWLHNGTIICPPCNEICRDPAACQFDSVPQSDAQSNDFQHSREMLALQAPCNAAHERHFFKAYLIQTTIWTLMSFCSKSFPFTIR